MNAGIPFHIVEWIKATGRADPESGPVVAFLAPVSKSVTGKVKAGDIIKTIAPIVGGKGGGKPELARGGGKDPSKLNEALAKLSELLA